MDKPNVTYGIWMGRGWLESYSDGMIFHTTDIGVAVAQLRHVTQLGGASDAAIMVFGPNGQPLPLEEDSPPNLSLQGHR
jgi:hypothetical protein